MFCQRTLSDMTILQLISIRLHHTQVASCALQITILARKPDDELLLLASDGLWDVLTNQEACSLAKRCLRRARQRGATRQSAARIAATVLTRAAVDRGSRDNVTVVVVDLMSGKIRDFLPLIVCLKTPLQSKTLLAGLVSACCFAFLCSWRT